MWSFIKKLIGNIIIFNISIFSFLIIAGFIAYNFLLDKKTVEVKDNSILHLKLNHPIIEKKTQKSPIQFLLEDADFLGNQNKMIDIHSLKEVIGTAKKDPKIKAIFLDLSYVSMGGAILKEVMSSLESFKQEKPIWAFATNMTEGAYTLASIADSIFIHPEGFIEFDGVSVALTYYKGLFDKLDIDPLVFRVGEYKSATEPFTRNNMSKENRAQVTELLNFYHTDILETIHNSSQIPMETLKEASNNALHISVDSALQLNMIHRMAYRDEFMSSLKKQLEIPEDEVINRVSLGDYQNNFDLSLKETKESENKIAVIVAEGMIGEQVNNQNNKRFINVKLLTKALKKAREDENVKAVILRINSPGGSYLSSDNIYREIALTKKEKPVIASMSNYAASGGYYIAMNCDKIIAQSNTITGSIGIFGLLFNIKGTLKKIGVSIDTVKSNPNADFLRTAFLVPMNSSQKEMCQKEIEKKYKKFIEKVALNRNIPLEEVKNIAGGRVWIGSKAKEIHLIDEIGGFEAAVEVAKEMAKLSDDYKLVFPEIQEWDFKFNSLSAILPKYLSGSKEINPWEQVEELLYLQGEQMILPFSIEIH